MQQKPRKSWMKYLQLWWFGTKANDNVIKYAGMTNQAAIFALAENCFHQHCRNSDIHVVVRTQSV